MTIEELVDAIKLEARRLQDERDKAVHESMLLKDEVSNWLAAASEHLDKMIWYDRGDLWECRGCGSHDREIHEPKCPAVPLLNFMVSDT
jgi:hypothetical protein